MKTTRTLAFIVLLTASCSSFEPGEQMSITEQDVSDKLQRIAFDIPEGFEFGQAFKYAEFVGHPAWAARFDALEELGDGLAISAANPSYPPLRPVSCSAAPADRWTSLGFTCEAEMLSMSRPAQGTADPVTVAFTRGAKGASLFIYCAGH